VVHYGKTSSDPNGSAFKGADLSGDAIIDIEDLSAMARLIIG
jgi:hypothetical protein